MLNSKTLGVTLAATVLVSLLPAFADELSSSTSLSSGGMGTSLNSSTTSLGGGAESTSSETSIKSTEPANLMESTHSATTTTIAPPQARVKSTTSVFR